MDFVEGHFLAAKPGSGGDLSQTRQADVEDFLGRSGVPGKDQRGRTTFPEVAETLGVPRHGRMEDFADLTAQDRSFFHEIAAVAAQELDGAV
jgi:hypothetical protein